MKTNTITLMVALIIMSTAGLTDSSAMSARRPSAILVAAPARYTVIQIANDILEKRPAVLASYQETTEGLFLHAWSGKSWFPITLEDFESASFMKTPPNQIVIIGEAESQAASTLEQSSTSCPKVSRIETLQTDALLNKLGRTLNFSESEWEWFAKRYDCDLDILNEDEIRQSWYDQKGSEFRSREAEMKAEQSETPAAEVEMEVEPVASEGEMEVETETPNAENTEQENKQEEVQIEKAEVVEIETGKQEDQKTEDENEKD